MIKNERQYRITKAQADKFAHSLSERAPDDGSDELMRELEANALQSQLNELQEQLRAYENLRSGDRAEISIASLDDLPRALVQARIAAGLSQKDLAARLGLKEQQVQRYEATDYQAASLARLRKVVDALNVQLGDGFRLTTRDGSEWIVPAFPLVRRGTWHQDRRSISAISRTAQRKRNGSRRYASKAEPDLLDWIPAAPVIARAIRVPAHQLVIAGQSGSCLHVSRYSPVLRNATISGGSRNRINTEPQHPYSSLSESENVF